MATDLGLTSVPCECINYLLDLRSWDVALCGKESGPLVGCRSSKSEVYNSSLVVDFQPRCQEVK